MLTQCHRTIVRHLPLANNIVVLERDGTVLEQGTFDQLRLQGGFVSNLIIRPGVLGGQEVSPIEQGKAQGSKVKAVQPPDASDLTRSIGDVAVYKYYFRSIGWKLVTANLTSSFIYMLGSQFPCTLSKLKSCFKTKLTAFQHFGLTFMLMGQ